MRRREFITLLGFTSALPFAVHAQQPGQVRRIGALMNLAADDPLAQIEIAGFVGGLQERGWTLGSNLKIEYRWGAGDAHLYRKYAAELVAFSRRYSGHWRHGCRRLARGDSYSAYRLRESHRSS